MAQLILEIRACMRESSRKFGVLFTSKPSKFSTGAANKLCYLGLVLRSTWELYYVLCEPQNRG